MQPTFGDGLFLHILQKKWPLLTSIKSFFPCYIYFTRYREFLPVYGCSTFEPVLIQRLLAHKIIKYGFLSVHSFLSKKCIKFSDVWNSRFLHYELSFYFLFWRKFSATSRWLCWTSCCIFAWGWQGRGCAFWKPFHSGHRYKSQARLIPIIDISQIL